MKTVCAILPLYNEEQYALKTINALLQIEVIDKIVAIDDGSEDNTWCIIENIKDIEKIKHEKNMGKGQSITDGIKSRDCDIYVFIDGDLGESAAMVRALIDEVLKDNCDMCIARFPQINTRGGFGIVRGFSRFAVKFITKHDFPCPLSGQRAVKREILIDDRIRLFNKFGIEVGMLIDAIKCNYRVSFIDLNMHHRVTGRNIKGFIHRFKQLIDIINVFFIELLRW